MAATEKQIKAWVGSSSRNWDQWCQAFVWNVCAKFGTAKSTYASAITAYHHSSIASKNASTAPAGAIHYWSIGTYGHVAVGLGGERVLMGSKNIDEKWGNNAGVTTVSRYTARTGAKYLGWSRTNGVNSVSIAAATSTRVQQVKALAKWLNTQKLGKKTTAQSDGIPGAVYWWLVQAAGRKAGLYPSPYLIDGKPGAKTYAAEKALIKKHS